MKQVLLILVLLVSAISARAASEFHLRTGSYRSDGNECFLQLAHSKEMKKLIVQVHDKNRENKTPCRFDNKLVEFDQSPDDKNYYTDPREGYFSPITIVTEDALVQAAQLFIYSDK